MNLDPSIGSFTCRLNSSHDPPSDAILKRLSLVYYQPPPHPLLPVHEHLAAMEIFMKNIPIAFHREYHLKVLLAEHLHGPNFPNVKANFHIDLFWPGKGIKTCVGTFTLADLPVAERFLGIYGGNRPRQIIEIGGNRIYFNKSFRSPDPQVLELLPRSRWVDPAHEREQQKCYEKLSSTPLPVKVVQVGWMCRDRVFSIEGEERNRSCNLIFEPERREVHLVFPRVKEHHNTHVIAIRQTSILSISAHTAGGDSVVYFQLEIPPLLLRRKWDHKPFFRMSSFPFQTLNPSATPFISLAFRVVFRQSNLNTFIDLAKTAGVHHIQKFQVATERRGLFDRTRLQRVQADIQSVDWPVAFQLEALLRSLYLDATELLEIIPQVKSHVQEHGSHYVATLLRAFAGKVCDMPCSSKNTVKTVLDCLDETHQALVKQTVLNWQPSTMEQSLYQTSHVTVTPTTILLTGPFLEKSNRVIRRYQKNHQENFLRVEFREEDGFQYRFDRGINGRGFIRDRLGPILENHLVVAGREFEFLAYSQSALRNHSVW
jgi:hypothetical protein